MHMYMYAIIVTDVAIMCVKINMLVCLLFMDVRLHVCMYVAVCESVLFVCYYVCVVMYL